MQLSLAPLTDLSGLAACLQRNGLPVDDLNEPGRRFWCALESDGGIVGYGGIEGTGPDVLLRSVVIDGTRRGAGLGRALVESLLAEAKAKGAARIWLLTVDAVDFFRYLGFTPGERAAAPAVVVKSRQFTTLCPASAHLMVKEA